MASMKDYETKCEINRMVNRYNEYIEQYDKSLNRSVFNLKVLWIWEIFLCPIGFGVGALLGLFIRLLSINRLPTSTWWITGVICAVVTFIGVFIACIVLNKYVKVAEQYKNNLSELINNMPDEYIDLFKEALRENAAAKANVDQTRAEIRAITNKIYNDKQASYNNYMRKRNAEIELNKAINELDDEINKLQ